MVYRATSLRGLAIAQMVIGALMTVFGVACIFFAQHWSSYPAGTGVWVGLWVFITGILGCIGARDALIPNKCLTGCFIGFSITGCAFSGQMFIGYSITLSFYSKMKAYCSNSYFNHDYDSFYNNRDCYRTYGFHRDTAANGAGLGSCLLLLSLVEFFLALASSMYCCTAVGCCFSTGVVSTTITNQQLMNVQPQCMYSGAQSGVVLKQTDAGVVPQIYPATGQQPVYIAQQPGVVAQPGSGFRQPPHWAVPLGSNPAEEMTEPYSAAAPQVQNQAQVQIPEAVKDEDMPPPYSFALTANVPSPAFSSVDANPNY
ncbi:uncharacterized protein [Pocillopora verrucosa]|uniref:uncharacterized protein n=1 Tax=Pocillopora verrucosa TaxID=203993 RepID=UPI003340E1DB